MYAQFHRFLAVMLLFGLLLQSCGNPNWKIVDDESPKGANTKRITLLRLSNAVSRQLLRLVMRHQANVRLMPQ